VTITAALLLNTDSKKAGSTLVILQWLWFRSCRVECENVTYKGWRWSWCTHHGMRTSPTVAEHCRKAGWQWHSKYIMVLCAGTKSTSTLKLLLMPLASSQR